MATKAGQFANQIGNKMGDLEAVRATRPIALDTDGGPLAHISDDGMLVLEDSYINKKDALILAAFIADQFTVI